MFGFIVAALSAGLFLAATKAKQPSTKRKAKQTRSGPAKSVRDKSKARRGVAVAPKKNATPQREEVKPEEIPTPPPPVPVQAPALFSPQPGASSESLTPSFRWFYVGYASHYQLVWSADTNFHKPNILLTNQTAADLPPEQALQPDTVYVWRVRGGNESGWGPWSGTRNFRTAER